MRKSLKIDYILNKLVNLNDIQLSIIMYLYFSGCFGDKHINIDKLVKKVSAKLRFRNQREIRDSLKYLIKNKLVGVKYHKSKSVYLAEDVRIVLHQLINTTILLLTYSNLIRKIFYYINFSSNDNSKVYFSNKINKNWREAINLEIISKCLLDFRIFSVSVSTTNVKPMISN